MCRASWAYLHTLAAFYPDKPDEAHAKRMHEFMLSYARFYPCGYCADTTSEEMVRNPPRTHIHNTYALACILATHSHSYELASCMTTPALPYARVLSTTHERKLVAMAQDGEARVMC